MDSSDAISNATNITPLPCDSLRSIQLVFIIRCTQEEYRSYYDALERAKHETVALEDTSFAKYFRYLSAQDTFWDGGTTTSALIEDTEGGTLGNKITILMWILMR